MNQKLNTAEPIPLYYQVYSSLIDRIRSGEFQIGSQLPTEAELIEEYGVSRITIIKSMNLLEKENLIKRYPGRGTFVSNIPRITPQVSINRNKFGSVGFISSVLSHSYIYDILMGVTQSLSAANFAVQVFGTTEDYDWETEYIEQAISRGVQGLLIYPHSRYDHQDFYRQLKQEKFPFIFVDRYYPNLDIDSVVFDDEKAGYDLTNLMIQKGHKRIAFIPTIEFKATSVLNRFKGYQRALKEANISYDEDLVWIDISQRIDYRYPLKQTDPSRSVRELLLQNIKEYNVSALFAVNQAVSESIIYALMSIESHTHSEGLVDSSLARKVSNNIILSYVGHQMPNPDIPNILAVALQSGGYLGTIAGELLHQRITHPQTEKSIMKKIQMEIIQI